MATGLGSVAAAPCGPLAREPHSGGGRDSRFPATRSTGRFQPRPIFGESLSRLRHPAPRGRRSWERARRASAAAPAFLKSASRPPTPGSPLREGPRGWPTPESAAPQSPAAARESPIQACAAGEAGGTGRCKDYVSFPSTPLLTRSPGGAASGRSVPDLECTPRNRGLGTLCRKVAFAETRTNLERVGTRGCLG